MCVEVIKVVPYAFNKVVSDTVVRVVDLLPQCACLVLLVDAFHLSLQLWKQYSIGLRSGGGQKDYLVLY